MSVLFFFVKQFIHTQHIHILSFIYSFFVNGIKAAV